MHAGPDFEQWYRSEHPRLLRSMYALTHDWEEARDVTDEAFTRALADWSRVATMDAPSVWVYRVAVNVERRTGRRRTLERNFTKRQRPQHAPPPDWSDVWPAVDRLPARQRTAVLLRFVADLPEAQIAKAMGVTRGTVSSTLAAARSGLGCII